MASREATTIVDREVEAALGVVVRACQYIEAELGTAMVTDRLFGAPLACAIRQQTARINQRRRKSFVSQWRHLLCHLAAELPDVPEVVRAELVRQRVLAFKISDQRGKNKEPAGIVAGANRWVEVDSELWEAQVDGATTKLLRPRNQPAVLLREFEAIYSKLKARKDVRNPALMAKLFPDVAEVTRRRWMEGRTPTPSELAMLVAAERAGLVPSRSNLSRLRQLLAGARTMRRLAAKRFVRQPVLWGGLYWGA